jgi:tetratricopeptide (TPR) repeat protein
MEDDEIEDDDQFEIKLSLPQILLFGLSALLFVYFSMAMTNFLLTKQQDRTIWTLMVPFQTGPSAQALHKKAVGFYRQGNYKKALKYFDRSLQEEKSNAKGFFLTAGAEAQLGRFDRAMKRMAYAEQLDPDLARIYVKKAYWLLGLKQYKRAITNARDYVSRSSVPVPNKFYGYLVILEAQRALGNKSKVEDTMQRLNDLKSQLKGWQRKLYRGVVLVDSERTEQSSNMSRGEKTELKSWKAIVLRRKGQLEQAKKAMEWVLRNGKNARYEYEMMLFMNKAFSN